MGYIREPENVDFIINSEPLTEQERMMISELIDNYKMSRRTIDEQKNVETAFVPILANSQFGSSILQY
jgi:predicted DNA-binding transcriptional regulator YafY